MMRVRIIFLVALVSIFIFWMIRRCSTVPNNNDADGKVVVNTANVQGDSSVNFIDANGLRQGHWEIYGIMKKDSSYPPDAKFAEGRYVDGKEEGEWIFYNPDGSIKKKVNYKVGVEVK